MCGRARPTVPRDFTPSWPWGVGSGSGAPGVSDITQHRTDAGRVYCAVVLDTYSRRVIGWSIADHLRTELVVVALEMACLRRHPGKGWAAVRLRSCRHPGPLAVLRAIR
jgi:transposase InsO family protein